MSALRIAFIADIHANLPALEAVVADLRTQAPDAVFHLGDLVNRCPWPGEVVDLIVAAGWAGIYGNHDHVVARLHTPENRTPFTDRDRFRDLWWTAGALTASQLKYLYDLPETLPLEFPGAPALRLIHGMPGNCYWGLYGGSPDAELAQQVASVAEAVDDIAFGTANGPTRLGPFVRVMSAASTMARADGPPEPMTMPVRGLETCSSDRPAISMSSCKAI